MFIPLHDGEPLRHVRAPYVTYGLIALCTALFLGSQLGLLPQTDPYLAAGFGIIPKVVFGGAYVPPELPQAHPLFTPLTSVFLHGGWVHLVGNMLFLWVFGDNVEDAMGHLKFLFFYLACAAAGALVHGLIMPVSEAPLIGASGAVSGVVAAYLMLHPKVRVWVLVFMRFPLPLPAFIPLVFWVGQQFVMLVIDADSNVSWGAHVGGIIAGAILVLFLRRPGVPLFDRAIVTPKAVEHAAPTVDVATVGPWGQRPAGDPRAREREEAANGAKTAASQPVRKVTHWGR